MKIYQVTEERFKEYGRVIGKDEVDLSDMLEKLSKMKVPEESTVYEASTETLEQCESKKRLEELFGDMEVQAGWCGGHNSLMNAVEYHKSSEVNVSTEDMILLLGRRRDIESDYTYDSSKLEAFLIPKGTVIEVYSTTLHYAPCHVSEKGFAMLVVLPVGTNTDLTNEEKEQAKKAQGEAKLLLARNKWLIAHPEAGIEGAFVGIKGENLKVDAI